MKLLIIGGYRFLGRHLVDQALAQGHEVTLFNRGRSPSVPGVETIQGDRHKDLDRLKGRRWDVEIDTCGYFPRAVEAAASALSEAVDRYIFISSVSVHSDNSVLYATEDAPLAELSAEELAEVDAADPTTPQGSALVGKLYGKLKVACERAAERAMPGRVLHVRPGLIVGEGDYSDRFTYWVDRVARGGEVLAPGRPDRFVQFIDVADLARWILHMAAQRASGVYTANGTPGAITMAALLEACKSVSGSDATFTWVDDAFLLEHGVAPWMQLPLWIPDSDEEMRGFMLVANAKAVAAGLAMRPVAETVGDVLRWHRANSARGEFKAGITAEREQELLKEWHEK